MKMTMKLAVVLNGSVLAFAAGIGIQHYNQERQAVLHDLEMKQAAADHQRDVEVQNTNEANALAQMVIAQAKRNIEEQVLTEQANCLANNIYHEARGEGAAGQIAIAWVTMNRVASDKYPNTVCGVVYQAVVDSNGTPIRDKCQFSWFCDGKSDAITNQSAWNTANAVANEVIAKYGSDIDPTNGAIMYHADYVEPYWASHYKREVRIDSHIFYAQG